MSQYLNFYTGVQKLLDKIADKISPNRPNLNSGDYQKSVLYSLDQIADAVDPSHPEITSGNYQKSVLKLLEYIADNYSGGGGGGGIDLGITGRGVTVWNMEGLTDHGTGTRQRVLDAAPEAKVFNGLDHLSADWSGVTNDYVEEDGKRYSAAEYIQKHDISVCTNSIGGKAVSKTITDFYLHYQKKYNLAMFSACGNDGRFGNSLPEAVSIYTGACKQMANGDLWMCNYSTSGRQYCDVDFSTFTGTQNGTSFAAPYLTGIGCLLRQRYGRDMTQAEIDHYLKMCAVQFEHSHPVDGHPNYDLWSGWGIPILPSWDKTLVRMTIGSKFYHVDGQAKTMDSAPFIYQQRIYVPIAFVALALGCTVAWDGQTQTVTISRDRDTVLMTIGKKWCLINGKPYEMDAAPFIQNQRTQVPIAFVALALGCKVEWIECERKVMILG